MTSFSSRIFKTLGVAQQTHVDNSRPVAAPTYIETDLSTAIQVPVTSSDVTVPSLALPPAVHYSSVEAQEDMMAEFFGGRPARLQQCSSNPPPYSQQKDWEKLPSYPGHTDEEPASLARYLFLYGFFFPLFWAVGVAILCSPLKTSPDWELGKTEGERKQLLLEMRAAELKWARRCLWALLALITVIAGIVLGVCLARFS